MAGVMKYRDADHRKAVDPLATATVAFFLAIPSFSIAWGWLWLILEIQISYWWVFVSAIVLAVIAYIFPGKWLENIWVFCLSLFFNTPVK
jgi:ABC-type dipeptide/oligopeptide/nickel transport system permease component